MYIQCIFLIQDWLNLATFKTQFSGTTCLIAMKLIQGREKAVHSFYIKFEANPVN